jgi:GNAT superfamily N-acetyltransferase
MLRELGEAPALFSFLRQDARAMIKVQRWVDLPDRAAAEAAITTIFFETSATQSFADEAAKTAFRERWLGRYLTHDGEHVSVALDEAGRIIGYLVGALDDPARAQRFGDLGFMQSFAALTALYPAHLHVNLTASARGKRVGEHLVAQFVDDVRAAQVPGVHVVTGRGVRNVGFYNRLGFEERGSLPTANGAMVFLGRAVAC